MVEEVLTCFSELHWILHRCQVLDSVKLRVWFLIEAYFGWNSWGDGRLRVLSVLVTFAFRDRRVTLIFVPFALPDLSPFLRHRSFSFWTFVEATFMCCFEHLMVLFIRSWLKCVASIDVWWEIRHIGVWLKHLVSRRSFRFVWHSGAPPWASRPLSFFWIYRLSVRFGRLPSDLSTIILGFELDLLRLSIPRVRVLTLLNILQIIINLHLLALVKQLLDVSDLSQHPFDKVLIFIKHCVTALFAFLLPLLDFLGLHEDCLCWWLDYSGDVTDLIEFFWVAEDLLGL